jgi:hypothetical protein
MGCLEHDGPLELLRRANAHFGRFFERFADAPVMGTDEEVEALLQVERTLHSIGVLLDGRLQTSADQQVREELSRYRENLVHLRSELSGMQQSAAGCKARLYSRQKHLHAAQAWCAASRATR